MLRKEDELNEDGTKKTIPMLRYYHVFHESQCDGLPEQKAESFEVIPSPEADVIISDYVNREGLALEHSDSGGAWYSPSRDLVHLPNPDQFKIPAYYYATAFHELTHSTGHEKRLQRFGAKEAVSFGSEVYSKEELVAELGSAMLMDACGMSGERSERNNAAYIHSWLQALQNDKRMIVMAAGKAEKAANYILNITAETTAPIVERS